MWHFEALKAPQDHFNGARFAVESAVLGQKPTISTSIPKESRAPRARLAPSTKLGSRLPLPERDRSWAAGLRLQEEYRHRREMLVPLRRQIEAHRQALQMIQYLA